ncbi:MAG: hypothetical protein H0S79_15110 [Anaerolineaceae bacterium]|nr:hypothetical protein [Anaerolineaceae bacterium]
MTDLGGLAKFGVLVVFAGFILDWLSISFGWKKFRPYAKTLALVILILWTALLFDFSPDRLGGLLLLALGFGLLGDILLLFPRRCFKWGLGAFLLGHITYLVLFYELFQIGRVEGLIAPIPAWVWVGIGAVIAIALTIFNRVIIRKMREPRPWWFFQVALYFYAICLTAVMVSGWLTAGLYTGEGIWIWALALGGTSFFISDFNLAYDRFVKPFKPAHILIMVSYHLAQFFLAVGFFMLLSNI